MGILEKMALTGKKGFVTGAARGIGKCTATAFAEAGADVAIVDLDIETAKKTAAELAEKTGRKVIAIQTDCTSKEQVDAMVEEVVAKLGGLDFCHNNAGICINAPAEEMRYEQWLKVININLNGIFLTDIAAGKYMLAHGGGSIINIGSMASCGGDLGSTAYACAKAGVDMLTKSTALQYGKQNIRCNCVRPGLIVTPENEAHVPQALKDIFTSNIMVNRYGCPEELGHMCVYLASDESSYVTGQIVNVDGGMNSHVPTVAQFRQLNSRTW